ncbi:hypothetical protein FHG87_023357 [Trinorchestia longiramus]|nr:hypothetical protein FHG87_023357 [Trinorchestia longiramus]
MPTTGPPAQEVNIKKYTILERVVQEFSRFPVICNRGVEETFEHLVLSAPYPSLSRIPELPSDHPLGKHQQHLVLECSKYEHERESFIGVVHEQYGENQWNTRCVEEDPGMRYLLGLDEECNMTVVDAMKNFLVHAWNKRDLC